MPNAIDSDKIVIIIHAFCPKPNEPGGWASLIRYRDKTDTISGSIYVTSIMHLYLTAILKAFEHLPLSAQLDIYTPSESLPQKLQQHSLPKKQKRSLVSEEEWQMLNELRSASRKYDLLWHQLRELKKNADVKLVRELAFLKFEQAERHLKRRIRKNERRAHLEGSLIYDLHQKQGPAEEHGGSIPFGGTSTGRKKRG